MVILVVEPYNDLKDSAGDNSQTTFTICQARKISYRSLAGMLGVGLSYQSGVDLPFKSMHESGKACIFPKHAHIPCVMNWKPGATFVYPCKRPCKIRTYAKKTRLSIFMEIPFTPTTVLRIRGDYSAGCVLIAFIRDLIMSISRLFET
ncbi:hypothetical protein VNO77_22706 [Canavalia gladiata]|uniref:Uncharacterized protein n=1 Tax=Canavalia gladiata TaxID=3824 RepID=A0AAN9QB85_CANGL